MRDTPRLERLKQGSFGVAILAVLNLLSCAHAGALSVDEAIGAWQTGYRSSALAAASHVYGRYLVDNDLNPELVERTREATVYILDNEPVIATGEPLASSIGEQAQLGESALRKNLRDDLISFKATRAARALSVIKGLELRGLARFVIALLYAPQIVEDDGGVLTDETPAVRTMVIKAMALDTLRGLE